MKYIFETNATMKEYNCKNWWIDSDIITRKYIEAEIDSATGEPKQCGYVITGKTDFQKDSGEWITQYIDLWVNILTVIDTNF